MARVTGGIVIQGTIDNICFYELDGKYCARMKPGPERKQFLRNRRYQPQREASIRMNKGNKVAALVYNHIPKDRRVYKINTELQKMAALYFKTELSVEEIAGVLCEWVVEMGYVSREEVEMVPDKARELDFSSCVPGSKMRRDIDHLRGVKIRTLGGKWIRLYHMDEVELLYEFEEEIEGGCDSWVPAFLERRKKLKTYRLRHKCKRRCKVRKKMEKSVTLDEGGTGVDAIVDAGVGRLTALVGYPVRRVFGSSDKKRRRRFRRSETLLTDST